MLSGTPGFVDMLYMESVVNAWENGSDSVFRGAPHLIIAHANRNNMIASLGAVIAVTYFELSALTFGLGSCWAGFFQIAAGKWMPIRKYINLPEENNMFGAVMLGYPRFKFQRIPFRN